MITVVIKLAEQPAPEPPTCDDYHVVMDSWVSGLKEHRKKRPQRQHAMFRSPMTSGDEAFWLQPERDISTVAGLQEAWLAYKSWFMKRPYIICQRSINETTLDVHEVRHYHRPDILNFMSYCQQLMTVWDELKQRQDMALTISIINAEIEAYVPQ